MSNLEGRKPIPLTAAQQKIYDAFVKALPGEVKTEYIENILDDYEFCISQNYPKPTIKKFYELFTKLVKKFGH